MSDAPPPNPHSKAEHFFVDGIVAARNHMPYVVISTEHGTVMQLSPAQARKIASDLQLAAARAEADAMIGRFFARSEFPQEALAHLMLMFREFRQGIDSEPVEGSEAPPLDERQG